jgi:hypothetical protein
MARIEKCAVDIYHDGHQRDWYYIDCQISYTAGIEEITTHAKSRHTPSPSRVVSPDPWARWREMQTWVDKHPQGTSIPVHYDPANHEQALLLETDMPLSGPNKPDNLRVLEAFAVLCAVMLAVATIIGRLGNKAADRVIPQ